MRKRITVFAICLILIISAFLTVSNTVYAETVTNANEISLKINISNLQEPVFNDTPSFDYSVDFLGKDKNRVSLFDFIAWNEIDDSYENASTAFKNIEEFWNLEDYVFDKLIRHNINEGNELDIDESYFEPTETIDKYKKDKCYIALFEGYFSTRIDNTDDDYQIPIVETTINGERENIRYMVSSADKSNGSDLKRYRVTLLALFEPTIPTQDIKTTINWKNALDNNIPTSMIVKLMNGETVVKEQTITKANAVDNDTWEYTFKDIPELDEEGNKITYTLAYEEAKKDDLKFFTTDVKDFVINNTFNPPELKSNVKMTSIVDRETNNVKYKIEFKSSIKKYSGDAEVVLTTTLPFDVDDTKSKLDGGTYDAKTRSIVWTETIINIENERDYNLTKNIDIYPTAVLPYAIEAKTVGQISLTAVADYSESVDAIDNIETGTGNPKTGDIDIQKYLSIGLVGIATILIVVAIKRKYSTKRNDVQY